jgi:hypothetical protein
MGARAARPYLKNLAQRETGNRKVSCGQYPHSQVPGLGPQVSGTGVQVQVRVPGEFRSRTWLPTAETQDLKMCLLRPTGQPFNYSTWSPSEPPGLSMFTPCPRVTLSTCPLAALPRSPLHLCTRHRRSCTFALPIICAPSQSSGLRFPFERSVVPLSTCQLANVSTSVPLWPTANRQPLLPASLLMPTHRVIRQI